MKLLLLIIATAVGVNLYLQEQAEIVQLELSKQTRGFSQHVRITADSLYVTTEDLKNSAPQSTITRPITKDQWTDLVKATKHLKLTDIPSLTSPTTKRASDAAMHSTLTIYTKGDRNFTHGFDDENPHEALRLLVKAIREIADQQPR